MNDRLKAIIDQFQIEGRFQTGEPYGAGHVHETYRVVCEGPDGQAVYLLQKINPKVFHNVIGVMAQVQRVTEHLRRALEARAPDQISRRALSLVPTHDGQIVWCDPQGQAWRVYPFIGGTQTLEVAQSLPQLEQAAQAYGQFLADLRDLAPSTFQETIADYHHGPRQFHACMKAVQKDSCYRLTQARSEVDFIKDHVQVLDQVQERIDHDELPLRIIHGDPKFNNVLLDQTTGEALCVIDLDTVMPGLALHDFGDMVRTMITEAPDDEPNIARVTLQSDYFEVLARGFLGGAASSLTPAEIDSLHLGIPFMPLMAAMRFLTDFLQGDLRFKTKRIRHNLQRCRVQLKLTELLLQHEDTWQEVLTRVKM